MRRDRLHPPVRSRKEKEKREKEERREECRRLFATARARILFAVDVQAKKSVTGSTSPIASANLTSGPTMVLTGDRVQEH